MVWPVSSDKWKTPSVWEERKNLLLSTILKLFIAHSFYLNNLNKQLRVYSGIRCIALHILQTSKGFWVFLFHQSFIVKVG